MQRESGICAVLREDDQARELCDSPKCSLLSSAQQNNINFFSASLTLALPVS